MMWASQSGIKAVRCDTRPCLCYYPAPGSMQCWKFCKADGTCFIEPALLHRNTIAHVKPSDAGIAAAYVIRQCVGNPPARGGYTENGQVGMWHEQALALRPWGITDFTDHGHPEGNDDLAVFISKFVPRVACSTQPYPRDPAVLEACEAIVDQMPTSKQQRIFAQEDICDPNLETPLPVYMTAPAKGTNYDLPFYDSL